MVVNLNSWVWDEVLTDHSGDNTEPDVSLNCTVVSPDEAPFVTESSIRSQSVVVTHVFMSIITFPPKALMLPSPAAEKLSVVQFTPSVVYWKF